jgi:hypothetical protein
MPCKLKSAAKKENSRTFPRSRLPSFKMSSRFETLLDPTLSYETQDSPDAFRKFSPNLTKFCLQKIQLA